LRQALSAGFDVHHLDGDHSNNAADNLILVERRDHNLLHGFSEDFTRSLEPAKRKRRKPNKRTIDRGISASSFRAQGWTWREIGTHLGCSHVAAMNCASAYERWKASGGEL
jgi:hypothetical protein